MQKTIKTVKDSATVERYAEQHAQMVAMLENLQEFVATMPAPDENFEIQGVDYGYIGDVARIHQCLKDASDVAYEVAS